MAKPSALEFWINTPTRHNYPWNIVRFWFPERVMIHDGQGNMTWDFWGSQTPGLWQDTPTGYRVEFDIPLGGKLSCTADKDGTAFDLTMTVTNTSDQDWKKITVANCLQLAAAGDYEDNTGQRTYWMLDGKPVTTYETAITDPGNRIRAYVNTPIEMKDGSKKKLTEPVAFVVSKDSKYVIVYSWQTGYRIWCNRAPIVACHHVEPAPFNVPAGQTKTLKGIVFVNEGSLEDAIARYRNWKKTL